MSRRYASEGTQAVASPTDSVLGIASATTIRPAIYDLMLGSSATPADNALNWLIQRFDTSDGAGTSHTPTPLDFDDPASLCVVLENHTTEPSYVAATVLLNLSVNQRATQRWVASPGGELKIPDVANSGIGIQPVHSSFTGSVEATVHHIE